MYREMPPTESFIGFPQCLSHTLAIVSEQGCLLLVTDHRISLEKSCLGCMRIFNEHVSCASMALAFPSYFFFKDCFMVCVALGCQANLFGSDGFWPKFHHWSIFWSFNFYIKKHVSVALASELLPASSSLIPAPAKWLAQPLKLEEDRELKILRCNQLVCHLPICLKICTSKNWSAVKYALYKKQNNFVHFMKFVVLAQPAPSLKSWSSIQETQESFWIWQSFQA